MQRAYYDFLVFQFLFGFGADAAGRAVSALSRCSRSRAVFASRAMRSMSVNARAASDVRSCLSCFSLWVNVCLSRIACPRSDGTALCWRPERLSADRVPQDNKKARRTLRHGGRSVVCTGWAGIVRKSYARRLRCVHQPAVGMYQQLAVIPHPCRPQPDGTGSDSGCAR